MSASGVDEPLDPDLTEGLAKQMFRAESPPDLPWDTKLFDRMGRSTEGLSVASEPVKEDYRQRASEMPLTPAP